MTSTPEQKEGMLEAEQLNLQLEGMQRRLQSLARSRVEAQELLVTLGNLPSVRDGDALLVPIATGLFTHARAVAGSALLVNIGDGVATEKPLDEVIVMVQQQIRKIDEQEEALHTQFDAGIARLTQLQESFGATGQWG